MSKHLKSISWVGIVLILIVGLVHVIDAKDSFQDAAYKGWLFYANGVAAAIAAYSIFKKQDWAWYFGLMIAVGSLGGYIASRTVGLPYIPAEPENWLEPLGVAAMIAEALFVIVFAARINSKDSF